MANLIGSGINQISVNGMLGNLAFQDKAYVNVDAIGIGTTFADTGTVGQVLQVSGSAYVSGNLGIGTTNPTNIFQVTGSNNSVGMTSDGKFLVGPTTPRVTGTVNRVFQIESVGTSGDYLAGMSITRNNTVANNFPVITLLKTRGVAYGATDIVQESDGLGSIIFYGADGTSSNPSGSSIVVTVDGPVSTGIVPGRFDFNTRDTSGTFAARMTIKNSGNIGIGTNLPTSKLSVAGDASITGPVFIGAATSTGTASQTLQVTGGAYVSSNVGVAVTSPSFAVDVSGDARVQSTGKMRFGGTAGTTNFYIQYNSTTNSLDFVAG